MLKWTFKSSHMERYINYPGIHYNAPLYFFCSFCLLMLPIGKRFITVVHIVWALTHNNWANTGLLGQPWPTSKLSVQMYVHVHKYMYEVIDYTLGLCILRCTYSVLIWRYRLMQIVLLKESLKIEGTLKICYGDHSKVNNAGGLK